MPPCIVTKMEINYCAGVLRASTFGRGIWETPLYRDTTIIPYPTTRITTNTHWNTDKYHKTSIIIDSNATLFLDTMTLYMPKNGEVIIMPGGKLVVDSSTITNGCEDCMWNGVRVVGYPNQSQLITQQGSVELLNSTIEHARVGIANHSSDGLAFQSTGGIVEAENTTFRNNARAVELEPYKYKTSYGVSLINYKAEFTQCVFELDDNFKGGIVDSFRSHVAIRDVRGSLFIGCEFYNRYTGTEYAGMGDGIRASNSKLYVRAYCDPNVSPCTYQKSQFRGLRTGIWIFGDGIEENTATLIDRAVFDSCAVGIHLLSSGNTMMTRNSFTVGNGAHINLHPVWDCYKNIGIWTDGSDAFIAEDNEFVGVTHAGQQSGHQNYGTLVDDSYVHPGVSTTIYNNTFDDLDYACLARGVNSNSQPRGPSYPDLYGLVYKCNSYDGNDTDIIVGYLDHPSNVIENIMEYQGVPDTSAGNVFLSTSSTSHLLSIPSYPMITYWHSGGSTEPNVNTSYPFIKMTATTAIDCSSRYPGSGGTNDVPMNSGGLGNAKNHFFVYRDLKQTEQADLDALIDGGDTEGLLDDIANWTQSDSTTVISTLLGYSPYVSVDAAMAVADANLLFQSSLIEILEENPEILKYEGFLEHLQYNIPNPLNGTQIDDLRTASESPSERSEYEANIVSYTASTSWYGNQVLYHYLLDTSATFIDSIPAWLDTLNTLNAAYKKVAHYAGLGDYTTAATVLSDIPNNFTMSDDEQNYYSLYNDLWDLLEDIRDDDRDILSMTSTEYDALVAIGEDENAVGKGIDNTVKGIRDQIDQGYGLPCDFNPIAIPNPKPGKNQNNTNNNQFNNRRLNKLASQNDFVIAYPNPANEQVTFEYEYQNVRSGLSLTVANSTGQVIKTINLRSYKGKTQWITDSVPSGVYIYELRDGESKIDVGRIVITK